MSDLLFEERIKELLGEESETNRVFTNPEEGYDYLNSWAEITSYEILMRGKDVKGVRVTHKAGKPTSAVIVFLENGSPGYENINLEGKVRGKRIDINLMNSLLDNTKSSEEPKSTLKEAFSNV